jgi:hypothetical protein
LNKVHDDWFMTQWNWLEPNIWKNLTNIVPPYNIVYWSGRGHSLYKNQFIKESSSKLGTCVCAMLVHHHHLAPCPTSCFVLYFCIVGEHTITCLDAVAVVSTWPLVTILCTGTQGLALIFICNMIVSINTDQIYVSCSAATSFWWNN